MGRLPTHLLRFGTRIADLLHPPRCAGCDRVGSSPFCDDCAETLVESPAGCSVCGQPLDEASSAQARARRCGPCRAHAPPFWRARAPYLHGGALAEAIHALKYSGREELAGPLGLLFAAAERPRSDVLVPVPLHPTRLRDRGYDQALLLARAAGAHFALPVQRLLERTRATPRQVGRTRAERLGNVRGAFRARAGAAGARCCVIDDVLTTGATAAEAAAALLRAGAARVEVLTLARAP